jgi:hypothetical protein
MKKLSVFVSLSLMLSSLSWAEKYEFVRLKINQETSGGNRDFEGWYQGEFVELKSGDVARVIAIPTDAVGRLVLWDGEDYIQYNATTEHLIFGPGTLYAAGSRNSGSISVGIERASATGSKTLSWNGSEWEGSDDSQLANNNSNNSSPVPDANSIKYDSLLGWCYFTDTPWFYSYTNGSWYYMHSMQDGIYVWNANLPNDGWMKLHG